MDIKMVVGSSSLKNFAKDLAGMIIVEANNNKMLKWSIESLALSIESGNSVLAFSGEEVVGHACLVPWKEYVEICALIVRDDMRKKRMGTRLMEEAVLLARETARKQIILLPNEASYPIGEGLGFSERDKNYFHPEIWEGCMRCHEIEKFPVCHCRPMVLEGIGDTKVIPLNVNDEYLMFETTKLYCEIWKEAPWNEDFWKAPEVIADMKDQMKKDSSIFLVAQSNNNVVGFTWGYNVDQSGMREICGSSSLDHLFYKKSSIFYVDELATVNSFRRKGIGAHLTQELIGEARNSGASIFCLRTDIKANVARTLYEALGFRDLGIQDKNYPNRTYWILD